MNLDLIKDLIQKEELRQKTHLTLIASENHCSAAVRAALGSYLTDKYAEGYPGRRYYNGCEVVDEIENVAIDAACKLFGSNFANVQPHSGSQANEAIYLAFLKHGDRILSLDLNHGGHLTHGYKINMSGKMYEVHHYLTNDDGIIDMNEVAAIADRVKPKLIIAGSSAYSRIIDWQMFRKIADSVGAYLLADVAHFSGLIAGKAYPSPVGIADFITSSTHKVLRGPRGGMILWNNPEFSRKINAGVFPGAQGGPLVHSIAGKAVCYLEALEPSYQEYCKQVILNAQTLAAELAHRGIEIISAGTDCHLFNISLLNQFPDLNGAEASDKLYESNISVNKELIPNDPRPAQETSGIRFGTAAATSRGMKEAEMKILAEVIFDSLANNKNGSDKVQELCAKFPLR